jgi:hypothetical protein
MKPTDQTLLLRDETIEPTESVLEHALGQVLFAVYQELIDSIKEEFDLNPEWRYYRDGKAWLCKVSNKKKTIFWLSIWEDLIKVSFYFTDKTRMGIMALDIDNKIKDVFSESKLVGKLIPLIIEVERREQLKDLITIVAYKMNPVLNEHKKGAYAQ